MDFKANTNTIQHEFESGFKNISKIVLQASNYDDILGSKRISKKIYQEIKKAIDKKDFENAIALLCTHSTRKEIDYYEIPDGFKVVYYGNTQNNQREFFFFKSLMRFAPDLSIYELRTKTGKASVEYANEIVKIIKPSLVNIVEQYSFSLSLIRQLVLYIDCFVSFWISLANSKSSLQGLIVANDHSPAQVAINKLCKILQIKRLYLQHAQITNNFPVLDFEYALLHDQKSKDTYLEIGASSCEIGIFPRGEKFSIKNWRTNIESIRRETSVDVTIYPSSVYDFEYLKKLIFILKSNSKVKQVSVKYHPQHVIEKSDITHILTDIPSYPHVAITGNSSVALELVARGNLVFIDGNLDSIIDDYYGFIKEGLCERLTSKDYAHVDFWKSGFSLLDREALVKKRFEHDLKSDDLILKKIYLDFTLNSETPQTREQRCMTAIVVHPRTFFSLSSKRNPMNMSDLETIKIYESLFAKRILPLTDCYLYFDDEKCVSVTDFWFIVKKIEWNGNFPTADSLRALEDFIISIPSIEKKLIGWLEQKFFDVLCRHAKPHKLIQFLRTTRSLKLDKLAINKKVAFLRYTDRWQDEGNELRELYNYKNDNSLTTLDKLKISVQANKSNALPNISLKDHYEIQKIFTEAIPMSLNEEYQKHIRPFFENPDFHFDFLDVKTNPDQQVCLLEKIIEKLRLKEPFSLIRLSDGEGYFFQKNNEPNRFTTDDARNRERHWWGEEIPMALRNSIIDTGLITIKSANIIGVPTVYRFLRDTSNKTVTFSTNLQARGLLSVLNGLLELKISGITITDDKVNNSLFNNDSYLEKIASAATKLILVSGALPERFDGLFKSNNNIEFIQIPTHSKQSGNSKFNSNARPLPYHYEKIYKNVLSSTHPGTLVLVGAGVAGKCFVHAAKIAGGCGIDVGSAFDEITGAGIHSLH